MTDNVTELHPLPQAGERVNHNAERQRRFRAKKRKSVTRNAAVTPQKAKPVEAVTPIARPPAQSPRVTPVLPYTAAIALAGAAAWFSVHGMVTLFPGAPMAVVGMAVAMESAKLVTAGWLARRWRETAWVWRGVLVALVGGLALINATGVYAQ